jgi:predicted phage baseplate assembly protein
MCLLPAGASSGDVKIVLWLTEQVPGSANAFGDFVSLFIDLETPEQIRSQWIYGAVADVPPPATLSWFYLSSNTGSLKQFPADAVEDGTGGLRRSGIVRFKLPGDWDRDQPGPNPPSQWPYAIVLRIDDASFSFPPVLKRIVPNVVSAKHQRRTQEHNIKVDWLPLPGQSLALPELSTPLGAGLPPLPDHPPLEDTVELSLSERDGEFEWKPAATLTFKGPDERVFLVDREKGRLRFGNGLTGRVPVVNRTNDPNLRVRYFTGGGESGNIGSNRSFEVVAQIDVQARNIVIAEGGAEPESLDSARRRAASALRRVERAITGPDHERVVLETPGVAFARAYAALGHHPLHPCRVVPGAVTIYVVPEAPRREGPEYDKDCAYVAAPQPDEGALAAARARVENARLVANEVFVSRADYRQVSVLVDARGDSPDPKALSERIRIALQNFLDPLRGGVQKQGWPFGEPIRPSVLLSEAQKAARLDANIQSVSIGLDCNAPAENCKDVEIKPHQLVVLRDVVVRLEPEASSQGGLR